MGSVTALSDTNGDLTESYSYDIFGKVTSSLSRVGNPYYFTGRRHDEETGLYYYRARMYDPEIGRFLQTDSIGYTAGLNLYAYVDNNPINWVDPLGLDKDKPDDEKPDPTGPDPTPRSPQPDNNEPWWPKWSEPLIPEYGNYGGARRTDPTYKKEPVDEMDKYFRRHDKALEEVTRDKADKELYGNLKQLPPNPRDWNPPAKNPLWANMYRRGAEKVFGDQVRENE